MNKQLSITQKIKSFEVACNHLGINPNHLPCVDTLPEKDRKSIIAYYKLTIIIRALNEGWEPDFSNYNEYKYYNWFYIEANKDGRSSGFRYCDTYYACTNAGLGSRLCCGNSADAEYIGKQFEDLYNDYL